MKKIIAVLVVCFFITQSNAKDDLAKEPWGMSFYEPVSSRAYNPNIHHEFRLDVVHTKQLEIQEYLLQRNDWQFIKLSEIEKVLSESESKLSELESKLSELESKLSESGKRTQITAWIGITLLGVIAFILFLILKRIGNIRLIGSTYSSLSTDKTTVPQSTKTIYDPNTHTYKKI